MVDHDCREYIKNGVCALCLGQKMVEQQGILGANAVMNNQVTQPVPNVPDPNINDRGIMMPNIPQSPRSVSVNKDGGAMSNMPIIRKVGDGEISKQMTRTNPTALKKTVAYMNKMQEGEYSGNQFYAHSDDAMFNNRVPRDNAKNIKPIGHSNDK